LRRGALKIPGKLPDGIAVRIASCPDIRRGIEAPALERQVCIRAGLQFRQPVLDGRRPVQVGVIAPSESQKRSPLFARIDIEDHPVGAGGFAVPVIAEGGNKAGEDAVGSGGVEFKNGAFVVERDGSGHTSLLGYDAHLVGDILTEARAGAFECGQNG
jgi:hypothetical protein